MPPPPPHRFQDLALARTALTHRGLGTPNNERLEWLGDAILQQETSLLLYARFPAASEGDLSQLRTHLVNRDALARLARRLNLGGQARLGKAGMRGGRNNDKLLANLMEAHLAAIHLDGGDVRAFIAALLADDIAALDTQIAAEGIQTLTNPKTRLQEYLQKRQFPAPTYTLVTRQGRADNPVFTIECSAATGHRARARGATRSAAEQNAARKCHHLIQTTPTAPPPA